MTTKQIEKELEKQLKFRYPFIEECYLKANISYIVGTKLKLIKKNLINNINITETRIKDNDFIKFHLWINDIEFCIDLWLKIGENYETR